MRILILGVSGLIGHNILKEFNDNMDVFGTLHKAKKKYGNLNLFSGKNIIENVDVKDFENLKSILFSVNPEIIFNCVGITKRKIDKTNPLEVIQVNSFFPHQLAEWAKDNNKRVIHFSTDCVFSGSEGSYLEDATPDALDYYGKTKGLGEVNSKSSLTIRSSMIGPELFNKTELFEWIINNKEKEINGFSRVMYSGVTTIYMARLLSDLIVNHKNLDGIYNVASKPISKFELLHLINDNFDLGLIINDNKTVISNKTLNASKIEKVIGLQPPSWDELIIELKKDYMNFIDLYKTI